VDLILSNLTLATIPAGETEFFSFQVVKVGTPCVLDIGAGRNPVTVGACTYFPLQGVASPGPGCGTPNAAASAGRIELVDTTKGTLLGSWTSQADSMSFAPPRWAPGDTVTVTASGAEVPSFSISVPVLSAPSITLPVSFSANQNLALSWTPDPNAQTMVVSINGGDSITCTPPDPAGALMIDASLFANLSSGPFTITIYRQYVATISDGPAQVEFTSYGSSETSSITRQ
jgi:hypothetical protein